MSLSWVLWIVPGLLLAFSVDVGLLSLAHQIRSGQRNRAKLLTFFVLSLAMAYSQFLYIVAHLPVVAIAAGVRADWQPVLGTVRDLAVVLLPALLPTALILYAFSDRPAAPAESTERSLNATTSESALVAVEQPVAYPVACPDCNWSGTYATEESARSALRGHKGHCTRIKVLEPEEVRQ